LQKPNWQGSSSRTGRRITPHCNWTNFKGTGYVSPGRTFTTWTPERERRGSFRKMSWRKVERRVDILPFKVETEEPTGFESNWSSTVLASLLVIWNAERTVTNLRADPSVETAKISLDEGTTSDATCVKRW
jgi:hypothetical protein